LTQLNASWGDDIGLYHAVDLGDLIQDRLIAVDRVVAIELRHQLLVGQNDDIGEFAVVEREGLQRVHGRHGVCGVQQLDEEIDIHHRSFLPEALCWCAGQ